ncbi:MAG: hypothetical protein AB8G11_14150 [Saprospiraceae bacterium]
MIIEGLVSIYNNKNEIHHQRIVINGANYQTLKRFKFYELSHVKNRDFDKEKVDISNFTKIENQIFNYKGKTYILHFKSIET